MRTTFVAYVSVGYPGYFEDLFLHSGSSLAARICRAAASGPISTFVNLVPA